MIPTCIAGSHEFWQSYRRPPFSRGRSSAGGRRRQRHDDGVSTDSMVDQVGAAIATADGADLESDPVRYRRLALAALKPLTQPTEAMVGVCSSMRSGRSTAGPTSRRRCGR